VKAGGLAPFESAKSKSFLLRNPIQQQVIQGHAKYSIRSDQAYRSPGFSSPTFVDRILLSEVEGLGRTQIHRAQSCLLPQQHSMPTSVCQFREHEKSQTVITINNGSQRVKA
jgi:hypothetical protein